MANKVTIQFEAEDQGLINHLEKLDKLSKKLTQTQKKLQAVANKEKSVKDKNREAIKKLNIQLAANNSNWKKAGISLESYTKAVKGNKVELAKVQIQTRRYIKNLNKVGTATKKVSHRTRILGGTFAVLRSKLLLFNFMLGLGIRQLGKFGTQASKVESMEKAFGTLTGGTELASDALIKLQEATNNTMSEFDLFQQANNAMILGVSKNSDEMAEMFDIAQRLGRALGRDTASSVESLVTGIGRQSRLMLDNIGIIVKSEEAYEAYANKLGVTTDELTDADRKQAFLEATMASARKKVATLGKEVLTNQDAYDKLSASASNLSSELGNTLQPLLTFLASGFTSVADSAAEMMKLQSEANVDVATLTTNEEKRKQLVASITQDEKTLNFLRKRGLINQDTILFNEEEILIKKHKLRRLEKAIRKEQRQQKELLEQQNKEAADLVKKEQDRLKAKEKAEFDEELRVIVGKKLQKEMEQLQKDIERDEKQHAENVKAAKETIFENDLQFQLKQLDAQAQYFKSLKLGADAEVQLEKWLADSKLKVREDFEEERISKQKESEEKLLDARKTIFEDNLEFQLNELDNQRDQLSQLLTTNEEKLALQDWFNNQQLELTKENLENNKIEFSAFNDFYKAFTDSIIDQDMTAADKKQAFQDAMVDGTVKFFGKLIQEHIKQYLVQETLSKANAARNAVNAVAEVALLKPIYAGLASVKTLALGTPYIATVGMAAQAHRASFEIAEKGGLIGGNRHSQGGTLIEAEQGEFIMSRNAVESIGVDNLFKMNEGRGAGITINISAPLVDETVVDSILPAIEKAQRMNLA